ncbi:hypothetical protein GWI33_007346 [Rhynchophorus ferrugineus]|uniref:Uncharacterized protein n=1 Tax=Rhynchophorus ferrugineus TaxID=354439 RepID=A0A834IDP6_RHYFE|nr:hypothetical protein GWI33_007346 [Rhynchophorus ferrugineus]
MRPEPNERINANSFHAAARLITSVASRGMSPELKETIAIIDQKSTDNHAENSFVLPSNVLRVSISSRCSVGRNSLPARPLGSGGYASPPFPGEPAPQITRFRTDGPQ